ncbi:MAG: hypothetical protein R3F22_04970 [Lysobacteraceae bacterium]
MTQRERLQVLANIDAMIALRDAARRRDTRKSRYAVELMNASIHLLRQRLRFNGRPACVDGDGLNA